MTRVGAVTVGRIDRTSVRNTASSAARAIPGLALMRSTIASWRIDRTDGALILAAAPLPHPERTARTASTRYFRLVIAQAPPGAGAVRQPRSSFIERPSAQREYLGESGDAASAAALCMDVFHDRAPRRPDEQFTNVVLGSVGVCFDGLVERDAVNREIRMSCGDPARYIKPGCRVRVFLAIERV